MITRKQYLEVAEFTIRDYYGQFVDERVKRIVLQRIPLKDLMKHKDNLSGIKLGIWDTVFYRCPAEINTKMREAGDYPTLAGMVCLAKEAARQIIMEEESK